MQFHHRSIPKQTAEIQFLSFSKADGRNHANRGRLGIDHTDSRLVGDDRRDGFSRGFARNDDHIKTYGADRGHRF